MPKAPAKSKKPKIPFNKKSLKSIRSMTRVAMSSKLNQPKYPNNTRKSEPAIEVAVMAMVYWILSFSLRVIKLIRMAIVVRKHK